MGCHEVVDVQEGLASRPAVANAHRENSVMAGGKEGNDETREEDIEVTVAVDVHDEWPVARGSAGRSKSSAT